MDLRLGYYESNSRLSVAAQRKQRQSRGISTPDAHRVHRQSSCLWHAPLLVQGYPGHRYHSGLEKESSRALARVIIGLAIVDQPY